MKLQEEIRLKAPAKIDLGLNVFWNKKIEKYDTFGIMQSIAIFDDVIIRRAGLSGFKIFCNDKTLEKNKSGFIYEFIKKMIEEYEINCGMVIKIFRRIPKEIDLGEEASICVAILKGLAKLFDLRMSKYQALQLCSKYGRDMVFCFLNGTVFINSNGGFKHLLALPRVFVLLVKMDFDFSQDDIFNELNSKKISFYSERANKLIYAINNHKLKLISRNLYNELETFICCLEPKIKEIKNFILQNNALGVNLNRFGKCMFGFYSDFDKAQKTGEKLEQNFSGTKCLVTKTIHSE